MAECVLGFKWCASACGVGGGLEDWGEGSLAEGEEGGDGGGGADRQLAGC